MTLTVEQRAALQRRIRQASDRAVRQWLAAELRRDDEERRDARTETTGDGQQPGAAQS